MAGWSVSNNVTGGFAKYLRTSGKTARQIEKEEENDLLKGSKVERKGNCRLE
jgi:hypothetical protein